MNRSTIIHKLVMFSEYPFRANFLGWVNPRKESVKLSEISVQTGWGAGDQPFANAISRVMRSVCPRPKQRGSDGGGAIVAAHLIDRRFGTVLRQCICNLLPQAIKLRGDDFAVSGLFADRVKDQILQLGVFIQESVDDLSDLRAHGSVTANSSCCLPANR